MSLGRLLPLSGLMIAAMKPSIGMAAYPAPQNIHFFFLARRAI